MNAVKKVFLVAALLGLASTVQAEGSVALRATAEREVTVLSADGQPVIQRVEAGKITPGDEVVYTIAYANQSDDPAENVVITNPVPEHMACVAVPEASPLQLTLSVDGGATFDTPDKLVVIEADGTERPAKLSDCTHLRWTMTHPLAPKAEGKVEFRAVLQ